MGDSIRTVQFRETLKGYKKDAVDTYLDKVAADADAGRMSADSLNHAPFPESLKGYHRDEVDDYIRTLGASFAIDGASMWSHEHNLSVPRSDARLGAKSNRIPVSRATDRASGRKARKGWTPLKMVLAVIFALGGAFAVIAGAATWHSVASRPHVVARVTSQFNCVTSNDTGPACDERIIFTVGSHQIHTVVRSIDPSRDLSGGPGHQYLTVFYDPTEPSHVEGVNGVAFQGFVMILGGLATIIGVVIVGLLITRDEKRERPGQPEKSEIHRAIVS